MDEDQLTAPRNALIAGTRPLAGRVAVVTGVSRRIGIGHAIAQRLLADGASVLVQSWVPHDDEQPWGADPGGIEAVLHSLGGTGRQLDHVLDHVSADFADPAAPQRVVDAALATFGAVDIVVANHARSSAMSLGALTADELDACWAVNVRATLLLVQAWADLHDDRRPGGRVVLFTSGQHLGPMTRELSYAVTKGALHQLTASLADALADRDITVNCVNPGPTDTGWATPEQQEQARRAMPAGRWGEPDDAARLVAWLVSDEARWVTGQIINSEGGFRRSVS